MGNVNKNFLSFLVDDGSLLLRQSRIKTKIIDYKDFQYQSLFVYSELVKDVCEIMKFFPKN